METNRFRDYFLGKSSAAEVEALELEIISNAEIEVEMQIAEENLIEDYLEDILSQVDKKKFEQNYLITNERRHQTEIIRNLKNLSQQKAALEIKPNFFEKLKALLTLRPITAVLAAVCLLLVIGFGWKFLFSSNQNNSEIVVLNQKDLSNLEDFKQLKKLSLNAGRLRSEGNSAQLNENNLTDNILLRLAFPVKIQSDMVFNVKILRNGQILSNLKQKTFQNQEIRLLLPKSVLTKGEYQVSLENGAENYNYFFIVQ